MLSLLLKDGREQHQSLRVSSIWIRLSEIFDHCLEAWQEVLVEVSEVVFLINIDLNQSEDVLSQSLHWLDPIVTSGLLDALADALRVILVNFDQVREDHTQMAQVLLANTDGYLLVNLDDMNQLFDIVRLHEHGHILRRIVQDVEPLGVGETQQLLDVELLLFLLS